MTALGDARTLPPAPEECSHPAPVTGVMAHEFASYEGALGPEGVRRTVTYYGPIIGGLPIGAWHCEVCGLLRLEYPDGRREERRLFPGPQPGLLAAAQAEIVESLHFGLQARVSGLSVPEPLYRSLVAAEGGPSGELAVRLPQLTLPTLPTLGTATWMTVGLLAVTAFGLLLTGIVAVYDYQTPGAEGPLAAVTALCGVSVVVLQVAVAAGRRLFPMPPLTPSIAESGRGKPDLDASTKWAVALLCLAAIGLLLTGFLAVYTTQTPDVEGAVAIGTVIAAGLAGAVKLAAVMQRRWGG